MIDELHASIKPVVQIIPSIQVPEHMVLVKGGTFQMGSNEYDDENPIHPVTLSDFFLLPNTHLPLRNMLHFAKQPIGSFPIMRGGVGAAAR